jgi:hypothetical protein
MTIPQITANRLQVEIATKSNAGGFAQGSITPLLGQTWYIATLAVHIPNATLIPTASVFMGGAKGAVDPQYFVDGTFMGHFDSTDRLQGYPLRNGEYIVVQWVGADPNVICYAPITGLWQ